MSPTRLLIALLAVLALLFATAAATVAVATPFDTLLLRTQPEHSSGTVEEEKVEHAADLLLRMFVPGHAWRSRESRDVTVGDMHGGTHCAACVIVVDILYQYSLLHEQPIDQVIEHICDIFPSTLQTPCKALVEKYGAVIIQSLERWQSPETACFEVKLCQDTVCQLHSNVTAWGAEGVSRHEKVAQLRTATVLRKGAMSEQVEMHPVRDYPWDWLVKKLEFVFNNHVPFIDADQDLFSTADTFRGSNWRGRDCDDLSKERYPGRKTASSDPRLDHNCNGIKGLDPQGRPYEDVLCSAVPSKGVAVLGDSAAAHFRIPAQWMTASELRPEIFEHALYAIEDELDWPELSAYTGFTNQSFGLVPGPMVSMYSQMRERNRCIHRDYQNQGVNGARVGAIADGIAQSLKRSQTDDNPLLLFHALIGNDVCNGHIDTFNHMTTPAEFEQSVLKTLSYLDTVLPAGSTVVFIGLVDGRILYNTMHNLTHPIGATYAQVYHYLNCLEISPCRGWLNVNATIRDMTTDRANQLNAVYPKIMKEQTYKHFDMLYYSFADLIGEAINEWTAQGGKVSDLIEPIDGFHPSQQGLYLTAKILWEQLEKEPTNPLGPVNPNNAIIDKLFGDQGGY